MNIHLVTPVYNDWTSFRMLLDGLDRAAGTLPFRFFVSAIDDGSTEPLEPALGDLAGLRHLRGVEVVHLAVNLGHQRAIATGICCAVEDGSADAVLIMDADGEDPPESLAYLLAGIDGRTDFCVVAKRRRREETFSFKLGYWLYKAAFRTVTGKVIDFGNYSILSSSYARRLIMVADLWNNLPAAILRSRLPITSIPIDRGRRYAGKSKMNFTALIVHGLSGISVYAETIFVRLLMLSLGLVAVTAVTVTALFILRLFFPAHATPGWATTITFGLAIIILQVLFTALSSILMLLNNRVQRLVVPKLDAPRYVERRRRLFGSSFAEAAHRA